MYDNHAKILTYDLERGYSIMEKIASFTIDHNKLQPGVYVSRKDHVGDGVITTFDLRNYMVRELHAFCLSQKRSRQRFLF